jgi:peptidoglycan/LPS O-acetylase OafA/YrhL
VLSSPPARIEQLTSLRFFAALAVLASHLWPLAEEPNPLQPVAKTLFHEGYAGVSFFFMLSGFILSHTYQAKLTSGAISRGKYLALRVGRIAPLHWLTGLPFAIWALATVGTASLPTSVVNLLLLQSWVPSQHWYFTLNAPSWSLSDELFFYTMFAGLAFLPLRRLGLFAALLLAANITMVAWLVAHGQGAITQTLPDGSDAMTRTHWLSYIAPLPRLLDFVVGMLVYRAPRPRLSPAAHTALEAAAIALLLAAMVAYPQIGLAEAWRMQLAYLPLMALVIWSFGTGGGRLSGFFARNATLVLLGDASFALYLIHLPLIQGALALRDHFQDSLPLLPLCGVTTLLAVGLSVVVYRLVEVPVLARTRRLVARAFPGG